MFVIQFKIGILIKNHKFHTLHALNVSSCWKRSSLDNIQSVYAGLCMLCCLIETNILMTHANKGKKDKFI